MVVKSSVASGDIKTLSVNYSLYPRPLLVVMT